MVLTPDVQIKAQKEVDAVTGGERLPNFDDWKSLPIVERIVYETLRWVIIAITSWKILKLSRFHPAVTLGNPSHNRFQNP